MKLIPLLVAVSFSMIFVPRAGAADTRCFEMRVYHAAPGKLEALHKRFRDHTNRLFEKHGMTLVGYWVPVDKEKGSENTLIYILAYPSREARNKAWEAFNKDPEWQKAYKESEINGRLVEKADVTFLDATDYSPAIKPSKSGSPRLFELRQYTTPDGKLPALYDRFRNHTMALFSKHGMEHIGYWAPQQGQKGAGATLIYILAHKSRDAADASFKAFRADPDWVKAKAESEANGSLTIPNGVVSTFMTPTDYSPIQ